MVKLKVSFDKSWGEINENVITVCEWNSAGKTGSGKMEAFIPKNWLPNWLWETLGFKLKLLV
jgi:hypothetical protein